MGAGAFLSRYALWGPLLFGFKGAVGWPWRLGDDFVMIFDEVFRTGARAWPVVFCRSFKSVVEFSRRGSGLPSVKVLP